MHWYGCKLCMCALPPVSRLICLAWSLPFCAGDCEMLGSQGSEQCSYASFAPLPSPGLASPSTPLQEDEVYAVPSPGSQDDCGSPASSPSPGGLPLPADSLGEHMLPLQHLLMSERAQHLSALEVKAIVYKVLVGCVVLPGSCCSRTRSVSHTQGIARTVHGQYSSGLPYLPPLVCNHMLCQTSILTCVQCMCACRSLLTWARCTMPACCTATSQLRLWR
jgi:hypothetical protein